MRVIILADGKAKRWESEIPKHLVEVNGEILLHRSVRLLKERGISDIWITTHNPDYQTEDTLLYEPRDNYYQLDQFFACNHLWRFWDVSPVIFLYGDVYFSENCIDSIVNSPCEDFLYFQRTGASKITGKPWKEGFAMKVAKTNEFFMKLCQLRSELVLGKIKNEHHQIQGYLEGNGMGPYWGIGPHGIEIDDETDDFDFFTDIARWTECVNKFKEGKTC